MKPIDRDPLTVIPSLRVLVPLVLGIMVHRMWHCWWAPALLLAAAACVYLLLIHQGKSPESRLSSRPRLVATLVVAALAMGWLTAVVHCPPRLTDAQRCSRMLQGRVAQLDYTDFSTRLTVDVLDKELPRCRVLLTTRGCDYTLRAGDMLLWPGHLEEVRSMGNPYEMNYAAWLRDSRGIRYEQHLPLSQLTRTGHHPTLLTRLAQMRRELSLQILHCSLSPEARRAVNALLLGESGWIDRDTRQAFSDAGVAHVLALSGLHVGLVAWLLWGLLFPLDLVGKRRWRLVLTWAAVLLYAVFTGCSPSVLRATIMMGFATASTLLQRRSSRLNALCVAALLILVCSPSSLYSVGFQLSFITVVAILLVIDLPPLFKSRHQVANRLLSAVLVSVVAIIATLSLTAHYFHTISVAGILTNLFVLPLLPLFMALGAILLLVTAAGLSWPALDRCIDLVWSCISRTVSTVGSVTWLHTSGVYVSTAGTVIYLVAMLLVVLWLYRRNYRWLMAAGCALALLLCHSLWMDARTPARGLVILNSRDDTPLFCFSHGTGYVWSPDGEEKDLTEFRQRYNGMLARYRIQDLVAVTDDNNLPAGEGFIKPPFAWLMGHRLAVVGKASHINQKPDADKIQVDELIVTRRFKGRIIELKKLFDFGCLHISGAMQSETENALRHECDSLGVEVHPLKDEGAFIILPPS